MNKIEELSAAVQKLDEEQVDALISFARSMARESFHATAPPEALASLERGLAQIARGETASIDELSRRLALAANRPS